MKTEPTDLARERAARVKSPFDSDPAPLSRAADGSATGPLFPADALPGVFGEHAQQLAHATQTPADMAATFTLGVLAACCGGKVQIQARRGWIEPANLFSVCVLPPGSRKSAVHRALTTPLRLAEQQLVAQHGPDIRTQEARREVLEGAARKTKADAERNKATEADVIDAIRRLSEHVVPPDPRILADDLTPERAATLFAEYGRLTISSAEGGTFDGLVGRYGNGTPNIDWALKGHAGDRMRVDRMGRPTEYIDSPSLTMILAAQPQVLRAAAANPMLRGRGLLARFLYSWPESNIGTRQIAPDPVDDDVAAEYERRVCDLAAALYGRTAPATLHLTDEAGQLLIAFETRLEPRMAAGQDLGESPMVAEWASKLAGAVVRIAGLLHIAGHPNLADALSQRISAATMDAAILVGRYFLAHALIAFDAMSASPDVELACLVLECIRRKGWDTFRVRDLFTALPRSRFSVVATLHTTLVLLAEHGYVTPQTVTTGGPGRPPSARFQVHPLVLSAATIEAVTGVGGAI
jgi:replicative DNA helicase